MRQSASSHELANENEHYQQQQQHHHHHHQQQRDDDQFRLSLLRQRMDLLEMLESKTQRTSEEENKPADLEKDSCANSARAPQEAV